MSTDPVGDALRADAEAARDEMRDMGVTCPSCQRNLGDLYGRDHQYEGAVRGGVPLALLNLNGTLKCGDGEPVDVATLDFDQIKAIANIGFLDSFWRAESAAMDRLVLGTRDGTGFAGILDTL